MFVRGWSLCCFVLLANTVLAQTEDWPDYRTVLADLKVPQMVDAEAGAAQRVRRTLPEFDSKAYYSLYLPSDWQPGQSYPVIVEYAGNGGYRDAASAEKRLQRLQGRPQFICGERDQIEQTRKYLASFELTNITFASTGFRNHSDQWILRPSRTRDQLRQWLSDVLEPSGAANKVSQ